MSENKFTKGEWIQDERNPVFIIVGISNVTIAKAYASNKTDEEINANAKLISAAPDLLEACKKALSILLLDYDSQDENLKMIESAIKKATA